MNRATSAATMNRPTYISHPTPPSLHPPSSSTARTSSASSTLPTLQTLSIAPPTARSARPSTAPPDALPTAAHSLLNVPLFPPRPAPASANIIVWFRLDLRLHDHPALCHALDDSHGGTVTPVYIFDPRSYGKTAYGFEKTGRHRANFLLQSVANLRHSLVERGSNLLIRTGIPEKVLPALARQLNASTVLCHREVLLPDGRLESAVSRALEKSGVQFSSFFSNCLYHIADLPFPVHHIPDVYVVFREAVQSSCKIRSPLPTPQSLPPFPRIDPGQIPTLQHLGLSKPPPSPDSNLYHGGEQEALNKLTQLIQHARAVPRGRSVADCLGTDFTCSISPWIAYGCLSPRLVYQKLRNAPKACQTTTYFELMWRDFFRYISLKYSQKTLLRDTSDAKSLPANHLQRAMSS